MDGDVKSIEKTCIREFYSVEIENGNDNAEIVVECWAVADDNWTPEWEIDYLDCPEDLKQKIDKDKVIDLVKDWRGEK